MRRDLWCLALLAAIATVAFADLLTVANTLYFRDTAYFIYPDRHLVWERQRAGNWLPMWDFRTSAGQPLAANPGYGVFYPPAWLLALFSNFNLAFNLFFVGHFLLAGAAMFALLRSLRASRPAAMFGAVSWMLGGLMASFACLPLFLYGAAWLPLFVLFGRRFLLERRWANFAGAALVLGMIITTGEAAMILQAVGLLAVFAIVCAIRDRTALLRAAAIVVAGILAGAAQLLPALELQRQSARAAGFSLSSVLGWSMRPARLLELIYPNVFGYFSSGGIFYWAKSAAVPGAPPFIFSFYPGLLVTVAAIAAFARRGRGWKIAAVVIGGSYLVAVGEHAPLYRLLYAAGLRNVRYPEKFFMAAIFVLVIFASLALDDLPRIRAAMARTLVVVAVGALVMYALSFSAPYRRLLVDSALFVIESRRGWLYATVEAAVLLALVLLQPRLRPALWIAAASAFVLADLAPRLPGLMPRVPGSFYTPPPTVARIANPAAARLFNRAQWEYLRRPPAGTPLDAKPWIVRNGLMPRLMTAWGLQGMFEIDINATAQQATTTLGQILWTMDANGRGDRVALLQALSGVTHVVKPRPFATAVRPEDVEPVDVIAVGNARYYFADQVIPTRSTGEFVDRLNSDARFSPRAAFVPMPSFAPAPGRVLRALEGNDRIELDVESAGAGLLALAITPHKFWRATIDGAPAPPIRANCAMQALLVPRGRHAVALVYRDPLVVAGATTSAVAVAALILLIAVARLRSRAQPPPSPR